MDMNMRPDTQEAAMARADLYKMANYSFKLFKMIKDGDQLEGWVQAKITKAADYVASVYHYLEYEMKFSEYGEKIENSDMYAESVKQEFKAKLMEARKKLEKLKQVDEDSELKKTGDKKKTATGELTKTDKGVIHRRTDYKDDESGEVNKTHAKSKSAAEKKNQAPALKQSKTGTWGMKDGQKFDNRNKKVKEAMAPMEPDGATAPPPKGPDGKYPVITSGPDKGLRWGDKNPKTGKPAVGPTNPAMKEALKGGQKKLDVDKDGKLEKSDFAKLRASKKVKEAAKPDFLDMDKDGDKKEPMKKAVGDKKKNPFVKVKEADEKCNHTPKGKKCPVHGLKECGSMYEGHAKNLKQQAAIAIAKKKAK